MEDKFYIAIEKQPHNYFPINLLDINLAGIFPTTNIEKLDSITLKYSKEELIKSIKEANLLDITDSMPLVVIYYEKKVVRKIPILTKDINFDMWSYLKINYSDKIFLNKIYNFLQNKITAEELNILKKQSKIEDFLLFISKLSYLNQRKLYFYLYETNHQ